ncbi:MAG TPA: homoserine dehydrogenase [Bacillales bacterium]|nr:homoserine dehydrogenase [Bacillales bacterium]
MAIKLALLGLGTVGQGVYDTIVARKDKLRRLFGEEVEIVAALVKNGEKKRPVDRNVKLTTDFRDILAIHDLDVVVEAIVGREPARTYNLALLERGVHVISANKECIAYEGRNFTETAKRHGVTFSYEASVGGGIPIIRTIRELLQVNRIEKIEGVLNGTCNFILTLMRENGFSFEEALNHAQVAGYAEADPTNDIEGWDAYFKLMVLSELAFGEQPSWQTTERKGITEITKEALLLAKENGNRIKLLVTLERTADGVEATVKPVEIGSDHPLYSVEGVNNAVHIQADLVGDLILQGPGAGAGPTASAIVEDLAHVFVKATHGKRLLQSVK